MNRNNYHKTYLLLLMGSLLWGNLPAQKKKDSLLLYKEFFTVGSSYQQVPLQAKILFTKSSNFIQGTADSSSTVAAFYLQKNVSYIHFGELEQLVTDSLVLFVSDGMKRLVLVENSPDIKQQMGAGMLPNLSKNSLETMALKYTIEKKALSPNESVFTLVSRKSLFGTSVPSDQMELRFNNSSLEPVSVRTIKRVLIKSVDSTAFSKEQLAKYSVHIDKAGDYFIKEQVDEYLFQHIGHKEDAVLPVMLSNRVIKDSAGEYQPAKGYEDYTISRQ